MTRRSIILLLIIFIVIVASAFAIWPRLKGVSENTWIIMSPNGEYRAVLTGNAAAPSWPFTDSSELQNRKVVANITKDGISLVEGEQIYGGGAYDNDFKDLYPDADWPSGNILHLWSKAASQNPSASARKIVVVNESGEVVSFMRIVAGKTNQFFIFDVAAQSKITLAVNLQHYEDVIGCEGKLGNRDLMYKSANYSLEDNQPNSTVYHVAIKREGCSVTREE